MEKKSRFLHAFNDKKNMKPISIINFLVNGKWTMFSNDFKYILCKGSYILNLERSTLWYKVHVFLYNQRFSILHINWLFKKNLFNCQLSILMHLQLLLIKDIQHKKNPLTREHNANEINKNEISRTHTFLSIFKDSVCNCIMKIDIQKNIKQIYHTMKILQVEKFTRKELRKKLSGTKIHKFKKV